MQRTSFRWPYAITLGMLLAAALAGGCGKPEPAVPSQQFVGTWMLAPPEIKEMKPGHYPTLTLDPDGSGLYTEYPDPHSMNISWVLRSGKVVISDRNGSFSQTYGVRFNGPDELILVLDGGEKTFRRYKGPSPEAGPAKPASAETAPTRGGSARPPARSRP